MCCCCFIHVVLTAHLSMQEPFLSRVVMHKWCLAFNLKTALNIPQTDFINHELCSLLITICQYGNDSRVYFRFRKWSDNISELVSLILSDITTTIWWQHVKNRWLTLILIELKLERILISWSCLSWTCKWKFNHDVRHHSKKQPINKK